MCSDHNSTYWLMLASLVTKVAVHCAHAKHMHAYLLVSKN